MAHLDDISQQNVVSEYYSESVSFEFQSTFYLTASIDIESDEVVFETTMPENSFFAIGFGYTMLDTDMIIWQGYTHAGEA